MTAVGKIFKPALRLDATRRALAEAIVEVAPQARVSTRVDERGSIIAEIGLSGEAGVRQATHERLSRFSIPYEIHELEGK